MKTKKSPSEKVYFVYLGDRLPYYAKSSLKLAQKYSGLDVHLLGNKTQQNQIRHLPVSFTAIEDFYDSKVFDQASKAISSPAEYRDGFWLKTLERIFVLHQYMDFAKLDSIFHAELDQVLFRVDKLLEELNLTGKAGIFLPFHSGHVAVASVFYCNKKTAIESLIEFANTQRKYPNEMELLADWVINNPGIGFGIPSILDLVDPDNTNTPKGSISINQVSGIADGMQIGMWIAGIDPRNVPLFERPKTRFVDPPEPLIATKKQFEKVFFEFDSKKGYLNARYNNLNSVRVFNLHIHSKIHNLINILGIQLIVKLANRRSPKHLISVRYQQIKFAMNKNLLKTMLNPLKVYKYFIENIKPRICK